MKLKQEIQFEDYKNCLENNKIILILQKSFRSETCNIFIEKVNKIALSSNNINGLQTLEGERHIHIVQMLE